MIGGLEGNSRILNYLSYEKIFKIDTKSSQITMVRCNTYKTITAFEISIVPYVPNVGLK